MHRDVPIPGQDPCGIAWDGVNLWVSDAGRGRIDRIDPQRGTVRSSFVFEGEPSGLAWDGECLWLLLAGWGVYVLDAEGNLLTMFNSSTPLPGIDQGLQLLGVSPRRALAVGSFGEHHRAWCGMLEVSPDNKPLIRLFHEATRVPEGRPPQDEMRHDVHQAHHDDRHRHETDFARRQPAEVFAES